MSPSRFDVLCIGNAIVDVLAMVDDDRLGAERINKGSMTLIDEARADQLYRSLSGATTISGGSGANTAVGIASLGGRAAFIGKVRTDALGTLFARDIRAAGVHFATAPAEAGPATARSVILVTPDGQRSMNTYLGACQGLDVDDIDAAVVQDSAIVYLEGYLWDPPAAKNAFVAAADLAHAAGRKVAITLSDSFCLDRFRSEFLGLIRDKIVDIVFANEAELLALYETASFDSAVAMIREDCALAIVTLGAKGSIVITPQAVTPVPAAPIVHLVDTTGAGDLFAAGFLCGLARGADHKTCARIGALAAAEIIQHLGARPERSLAGLAKDEDLQF